MAANRFATMLHRNTNKITLILIYAVLEWILIVLLLLNSLFSYLIIKYAEYFGLKPPCPWCSKLHQIFDPAKGNKNLHMDFLCELHSQEISKLGYCLNHQKLSETQEMCEDCLFSTPEVKGSSKDFSLFPRIRESVVVQKDKEKVGENGEVERLNCSCCGVSLNSNNNIYSSYMLLKSSAWDVLECAQKENLIRDARDYLEDNHIEEVCDSDKKVLDFVTRLSDDEKVLENENENQILAEFDRSGLEVNDEGKEENVSTSVSVDGVKKLEGGEDDKGDEGLEMEARKESLREENSTFIKKDKSVQVFFEEDSPLEISPKHLEFFLDFSGHKLVPVELIDSITEEYNSKENTEAGVDGMEKDEDFSLDSDIRFEKKEELVDVDINEVPKFAVLESMEMEEDENSLVFHTKDCNLVEDFEQFTVFPASQFPSSNAGNNVEKPAGAAGEMHSDVHSACEDGAVLSNNENEADVSIGTEIPDLDAADEMQNQESVHSYEFTHEDHPLTISTNVYEPYDHCSMQAEEEMVEFQSLSAKDRELNEIEEDKVPDTPTSMDSLNQLHKKLMFLEKRDSESLDGSVTSELDGGDGVVTIEGLKSALRAERKALQVLYAELEEERSASAVAANQTMAMINRLQEEKAAMQMEALQYQRMMEEQSEYDQEALQLLNELMVKREKEKHELEKELEVYRKKLSDYETREKMRVGKKSKDGSSRSGFSSASCSNAEDSDGMSIDLNQEAKEEEGFYGHQEYVTHNTPVDAVVNLEESLSDFEEERLSILEQLKVLEEKLMTLDESEEPHFEDVRPLENSGVENGNHVDENGYFHGEANGHGNGFLREANGKHQTRRIPGQKGRSLLPLFDATSDENGDAELNGNGNGVDFHEETLNKKLAIGEEVDHLYDRLQALEADREFLKHCISSLKKGDKGMDLLQEILQHLRDLRNVELRVRNLSDGSTI